MGHPSTRFIRNMETGAIEHASVAMKREPRYQGQSGSFKGLTNFLADRHQQIKDGILPADYREIRQGSAPTTKGKVLTPTKEFEKKQQSKKSQRARSLGSGDSEKRKTLLGD